MLRSVPNAANREGNPGHAQNRRGRARNKDIVFVTANVTSWQSAQSFVCGAQADVIFVQETKASDTQAKNFRNRARQAGFNFESAAASGEANARSAGVMLAWKRHLACTHSAVVQSTDRTVGVQ